VDLLFIEKYKSRIKLKSGQSLSVRPLLPSDEIAYRNFFYKLKEETVYLRFFRKIKVFSRQMTQSPLGGTGLLQKHCADRPCSQQRKQGNRGHRHLYGIQRKQGGSALCGTGGFPGARHCIISAQLTGNDRKEKWFPGIHRLRAG